MVDDDRDRIDKETDYLRHASVLLDDGEVTVTDVDARAAAEQAAEDWAWIRRHGRLSRPASRRGWDR